MLVAGRARVIASGSTANQRALKSWDSAVREAAAQAVGACDAPPFVGVALRLEIEFRMARPAGHWGSGKHAGTLKPSAPRFPAVKPDSSKLLRATEDSLIGVVFDDDSRIVDTHIRKVYARPGEAGATIIVAAIDEDVATTHREATS